MMKKTNKKAVWSQMEKIFSFLLFMIIIVAVYVALKNNWLGLENQANGEYLTSDWDHDGLPNGADTCACTHSSIGMDDHPDGGRKTCVATWNTKETCLADGREGYFQWYEDKETGKKMCYYENVKNGCVDWLREEYYPAQEKAIAEKNKAIEDAKKKT